MTRPFQPRPTGPLPTFDLLAHALSDDINVMPLEACFGPPPLQWEGPIPAVPERSEPAAAASAVPPLTLPKLQSHSCRLAPSAEDVACRARAITAWCGVFDRMGDAFRAVRKIGGVITEPAIADFMEVKATGTLLTRASAWPLYFRYAGENGFDASTLGESAAFAYLTHLERVGAPAT